MKRIITILILILALTLVFGFMFIPKDEVKLIAYNCDNSDAYWETVTNDYNLINEMKYIKNELNNFGIYNVCFDSVQQYNIWS